MFGINLYNRYRSNQEFFAKNLEVDIYTAIYSNYHVKIVINKFTEKVADIYLISILNIG